MCICPCGRTRTGGEAFTRRRAQEPGGRRPCARGPAASGTFSRHRRERLLLVGPSPGADKQRCVFLSPGTRTHCASRAAGFLVGAGERSVPGAGNGAVDARGENK